MSIERPTFGTLGFYEALAESMNNDPTWLDMAKPITYAFVYSYSEPINKSFFLNFEEGKITEVAELSSPDDRKADFVISGPPEVWEELIKKALSPMSAMAGGKLGIQGSKTTLMRHMSRFKYLLEKMTTLDPVFS